MSLYSATSSGFGHEPLDVGGVVKEASNFDYNPDIPLRYWLRTAAAIQSQAQSYERDGNEQDAYLFYFRHVHLVLEKLATHPEIRLPPNRPLWRRVYADAMANLTKLEELKPRINMRYKQHLDDMARRKARQDRWEQEHPKSTRRSMANDGESLRPPSSGSERKKHRKELKAGENRSYAVALANKEFRRRKETHDAQYGAERLPSHTPVHGHTPARRGSASYDDQTYDVSRDLIATQRRVEQAFSERNSAQSSSRKSSESATVPRYPTVPQKSASNVSTDSRPEVPPKYELHDLMSRTSLDPRIPPKLPPKENVVCDPWAPLVPAKVLDQVPLEAVSRASTETPPPADIDSKDYTFNPSAWTEGGEPLRTVFINPNLRFQFLDIARSNTRRNLETCGILCGHLISNAFFITKLVIPEQESTSDTCDTVNEGALFDYCDKENLMTLGWIHTHPTQTCFLSSRDLHTHSGYQVQLAESIAIVCAPQHDPSYGVFRLTAPPGLKSVLNCRQTGLFHPHPEPNVYTDAMRPGHVMELAGLEFDIVDLRP
ncbi:Mov34-domain-containing protein [Trichodelitschia bisporula]|uniref:Mov34-domain-containing protein n=1 Tax=Trichodelitschia bisporula TaxID=703511 RepID=A0A6G1HVL8_9PEZI|nr:Mov34-domain-containing protein [Trichodelitschia bisporula]